MLSAIYKLLASAQGFWKMKTMFVIFIVLIQLFCGGASADNHCIDPRDTFDDYDNSVPERKIKDIGSDYYILSYSWAPSHCAKAREHTKLPGGKNFLQCSSGRNFGCILHAL